MFEPGYTSEKSCCTDVQQKKGRSRHGWLNLIKVFVSSRDDIDIVLRLKHSPNVFIQASDNKEDIENFVHAEVEHSINNHKLLRGQVPSQLKIQIISALIEGAQGM